MKLLNKLSDFLGKYFIVLVLLMVAAAMALPQILSYWEEQEF